MASRDLTHAVHGSNLRVSIRVASSKRITIVVDVRRAFIG